MNNERTYAQIDLDAIGHNVGLVRKKIGNEVKILGVVKADAYGHGAVEVSRFLEPKVDYFAVAVVEEAVQLRKAGIIKPIMILGGVPEGRYGELARYDIMPTIYSVEAAEAFAKAAEAEHKSGKIHIAVDTGMSRIGFQPSEISQIIKISQIKNLVIEGIFTHYACADECDKTYSRDQLAKFIAVTDALEQNGIHIPIKHISNSAGIIEFDKNHFNMVRTGIMTYGLYPSPVVDKTFGLKPAMSLLSYVAHLKTLDRGHGVSYGATYVTKGETVIATIPAGYADGYPRALSSKGRVLIRGEYAPILGRVCMDQFMVDVTHIPGVRLGDKVTLVGTDDGKTIPVEELADNASSFNYEFVCGIGIRVPRVYLKEGKVFKVVKYIG